MYIINPPPDILVRKYQEVHGRVLFCAFQPEGIEFIEPSEIRYL